VKVLLKLDVPKLGKAGEVKAVADGYARNYLIPQGMAVIATRGVLTQARSTHQREERRDTRLEEQAQELASALGGITLTFHVRAGENDQLYGSITNVDIVQELERQLGRAVDRRHIELEEPIRRLGSYRVPVRLGDGLALRIGVVVQRLEE